jgi:GAF domain-containing protein
MQLNNLKQKISLIINSSNIKEEKLQAICDYLESEISYYDWVGFYFKNGNKNELN